MLRNAPAIRLTGHPATRGFTLIEVTVALVLASLVLLTAHRLGSALLDAVRHSSTSEQALARTANVRRVLVHVLGSVQAGVSDGDGFTGDTTKITCTSWFTDGDGWPTRGRVTLSHNAKSLTLEGLPGGAVVLADSVARVRFDYLLGLGARSSWVRGWSSPVSAPLAVRIRLERAAGAPADTILLFIGPRG